MGMAGEVLRTQKLCLRASSQAIVESKALRYNFSFGNSLSKQLQNSMKVNGSYLTKIIRSFTCLASFNKTNN